MCGHKPSRTTRGRFLVAAFACGCFDLAGRIRDLKEDGYFILGEFVEVENRFGEKVRIKQYRLVER